METIVDKNESKIWPDKIVKAFIDIMVDEVTKGNMQNGVFHSRTWNFMTTRLNSTTNRSFSVKQLKQKMNRLQSMHREFSLLLQHTGFGWNVDTNIVTATEEVWQNYIQTHGKAAQFQKKGCEHYKLLGIIFNKSTATGVLHHSSTQDPPNTDEENELENQYHNTGVHVNVDKNSSNNDIQQVEHITRSGKRIIQIKEWKSKKESRKNEMRDALVAWAEAFRAKAKATSAKAEGIKARSMEATSSITLSDYSSAKCVTALEDITNDIYMKALEKFKEPEWREMFLTMSSDRRRAWLYRL